jgi:hypothetical protein
MAHHGKDSALTKALGNDFKGKISLLIYAIAIACSFWYPLVSFLLYILVAALWFVPDQRIEKILSDKSN